MENINILILNVGRNYLKNYLKQVYLTHKLDLNRYDIAVNDDNTDV